MLNRNVAGAVRTGLHFTRQRRGQGKIEPKSSVFFACGGTPVPKSEPNINLKRTKCLDRRSFTLLIYLFHNIFKNSSISNCSYSSKSIFEYSPLFNACIEMRLLCSFMIKSLETP